MKIDKLSKYVLFFTSSYLLYPSFGDGLFLGILSLIFYLVLLIIAYSFIDDGINYITRNWRDIYLKWIDEKEHVKGNTLANITQLDFIGMMIRFLNYIRYNKNRFFEKVNYIFKNNLILWITIFILIILMIIKIYLF